MRKQVSFGVCALTFLSFAAPIRAQLWSGVISPSRAVDWSSAGSSAVAAEASWTQCGSTIAAGASYSTINAALSNWVQGLSIWLAACSGITNRM
jgi:hypothetical protein